MQVPQPMQVPQDCDAEPGSDEWWNHLAALQRAADAIAQELAQVTMLLRSIGSDTGLDVADLLRPDDPLPPGDGALTAAYRRARPAHLRRC
ncbi:MAG: hypothetical protein WHS89_12330 [Acidimicrobiales bacterium]